MMTKLLILELSIADVVDLLNRNESNLPPQHLDASTAVMEMEERDDEDILVVTVRL